MVPPASAARDTCTNNTTAAAAAATATTTTTTTTTGLGLLLSKVSSSVLAVSATCILRIAGSNMASFTAVLARAVQC